MIRELTLEDLKNGFYFDPDEENTVCLACGEKYLKGRIYQKNELFMDHELAAKTHIKENHGSAFLWLSGLDKKQNGLSEVHKQIIGLIYQGMNDEDIARKLDNKSASTIRNHRFILREKYKEAKIFTALMELLDEKTKNPDRLVEFHDSLTVKDERRIVTEKEKEEIIEKYFSHNKLSSFPKKEKKKLVILKQIAEGLDKNKKYSEKEINQIIGEIYSDFVTIRRYLIEYGFLDRLADGSEYWLK